MESSHRILYIAVAVLIFSAFVGLLMSFANTERQNFRKLSEDTSETFIMGNSINRSNFNDIVTGSELKYALLHAENKEFKINGVKITDANCNEFYSAIKNSDIFTSTLTQGVWEFTLDTAKSHRINNSTLLQDIEEESLKNIEIQSSETEIIAQNTVEELSVGKVYTYTELESLIENANHSAEFLFSGVFGNFSCPNGDISNLELLVNSLNLNKNEKLFRVDNSSIIKLQQVSFTVDENVVTSDLILSKYLNKLIYGNNLIKMLENKRGVECYVNDGVSRNLISESKIYDLKRTEVYCVYEISDGVEIKNSKLIPGITLEGSYWLTWKDSCGSSWSYNVEIEKSTNYKFVSFAYNPIGIITQINLELLKE